MHWLGFQCYLPAIEACLSRPADFRFLQAEMQVTSAKSFRTLNVAQGPIVNLFYRLKVTGNKPALAVHLCALQRALCNQHWSHQAQQLEALIG